MTSVPSRHPSKGTRIGRQIPYGIRETRRRAGELRDTGSGELDDRRVGNYAIVDILDLVSMSGPNHAKIVEGSGIRGIRVTDPEAAPSLFSRRRWSSMWSLKDVGSIDRCLRIAGGICAQRERASKNTCAADE
jgi:hypothetical protein